MKTNFDLSAHLKRMAIWIILLAGCTPKPYYVFRYETYTPKESSLLNPVNPRPTESNFISDITEPSFVDISMESTKETIVSTMLQPKTIVPQTRPELPKIEIDKMAEPTTGIKSPEKAAKAGIWLSILSGLMLLIAVGPNITWLAVAGLAVYLGGLAASIIGLRSENRKLARWSMFTSLLIGLPWIFAVILYLSWAGA